MGGSVLAGAEHTPKYLVHPETKTWLRAGIAGQSYNTKWSWVVT